MDARGQLMIRENMCFLVSVRAWEFGLARRVRPSRPASAFSFSIILRLNLVLTQGIPPDFRGGVHLFTLSGQSRVYRVTQLRTDGVHYRESAGTGPVVLKVISGTGAAFAHRHGPIHVRLSFSTPTILLLVKSGYINSML